MGGINGGRLVLGGLAAAVLMFLADGFIHEVLLHPLWLETITAAGRSLAQNESEHGYGMVYFAVHELLKGLALAWVYVAMRSRFGAGAKTAVLAGLTVWAIMFPVPFVADVPIGLHPPRLLALWALYETVPTVVGGLAAGFIYKDAAIAS
jgi:hypothetical protein